MMDKSSEQLRQIQEAIGSLDPLVKSYLETITYDYMITQIYAEFEEEINKILREYLYSDNILTNNYLNYQKKLHRGLEISDITSILRDLKVIGKGEVLCSDKISTTHHQFLDIRHKLTHTIHKERTTDLKIEDIVTNTKKILEQLSEVFGNYAKK